MGNFIDKIIGDFNTWGLENLGWLRPSPTNGFYALFPLGAAWDLVTNIPPHDIYNTYRTGIVLGWGTVGEILYRNQVGPIWSYFSTYLVLSTLYYMGAMALWKADQNPWYGYDPCGNPVQRGTGGPGQGGGGAC